MDKLLAFEEWGNFELFKNGRTLTIQNGQTSNYSKLGKLIFNFSRRYKIYSKIYKLSPVDEDKTIQLCVSGNIIIL
jgi:hypothetical protein